jgi:hypothetical protein
MNFQIHFDIPFYVFLLFGGLSASLSYLMYRRLEAISKPRQLFLGILRGASLFLLLLAAANLITDFVRFDTKKRDVYLLLDDSKSMSLSDGKMSREQVVKDILGSKSLGVLAKYFNVKPVVFGGTIIAGATIDSLRFDRPATDLQAAVSQASKMDANGRTAFAVLLSDGDYNAGGNPVDAARSLSFPLYSVGIGDSTLPRDVVVKQVIPAPSIYAGKKSVVRAIISSNGFGGASVNARLIDDGREVDSRDVTLPPDGEKELSFDYTPASVGTHLLKVYIPPLSGEFNRRNNSASATAEVRKGKYSILLIAGEPASDVAFLRRNIGESDDFDLKVLIQKSGASFDEKNAAGVLSQKYDAVILYDFPNGQSAGTFREVTRVLNSTEVPFAYFAGNQLSAVRLADLQRLPLVVTGFQNEEFQVGISPTGAGSLPVVLQPLYTLLSASSALLPPLYYQRIECRPKAGAVALAYPVFNGVKLNSPVFVIDPATRSAAFLAYGLWRFQLMSSLSGVRSDFLEDLVGSLIRTLISGGKQKLLTVHVDRKVYDPSEPVSFNALLVGQGGSPVNDASVHVNVKSVATGRICADFTLSSMGDGGYSGGTAGLGEGKYLFTAAARSGSTFLGADSGSVVVEPLNTEFIRTSMNAPLMRQLASVSGGEFMTPSKFIREGVELRPEWLEPLRLANSKRFELLSSLPILAVVLLLLAVEWTIRKVWGLP